MIKTHKFKNFEQVYAQERIYKKTKRIENLSICAGDEGLEVTYSMSDKDKPIIGYALMGSKDLQENSDD